MAPAQTIHGLKPWITSDTSTMVWEPGNGAVWDRLIALLHDNPQGSPTRTHLR